VIFTGVVEALITTITALLTLIVAQFFTQSAAGAVWGAITGTLITLPDVMLGSFVFSLAADKTLSLLFGARKFSR
jgi:hypothetical protein